MTILIDEKHFCEYRYSNRGNIKCQPIDFSHSKYVDIGMYVYKKNSYRIGFECPTDSYLSNVILTSESSRSKTILQLVYQKNIQCT